MKNSIFIIILATIIFPQTLIAQNWIYQLNWVGKAAFSAYTLSGTIQLKSAALIMDNESIQTGKFVVDMKTIISKMKDLTKHLKSKDFFEVKKYKTATFELTELTINEGGEQMAKGQLTVKNITKPITFLITQHVVDNQLSVKGKAIINRTAFGITFNSPSFFKKMKDQAIADDFELGFELVFLRE